MDDQNEKDNSWTEDLAELIRIKKEENEILKMLGESLSHPGKTLPGNQPDPAECNEYNESNGNNENNG
ncbi:MAG: hypothetical protein ACOYN5_14015 [Bacteroidales bacterium]